MPLGKNCLLLICLCSTTASIAQIFTDKNYPQNYFSWPVIAKKALVANFGELRPNHFHMGLDCRTDQVENKPVVAAADGWIAKVKIEPFGFGRCIYINHPNGLTTVYAHLNDFYPALETYVRQQQYLLQSWDVFLDIPSALFLVRKEQLIAYSGNTGGSQGPHTHFEIRETKTDKVLNPLLFGLPVVDRTAPDILRLAVYDRELSTMQQQPRLYPVRKINGVYTILPKLLLTSSRKISFAITAFDRYTGSTNKNGIYQSELWVDQRPVCGFRLNEISYDDTRYLNAHIDYRLHEGGGPYVQHLSRLPGNPSGIYKAVAGDGVINIEDGAVHQVRILVKDVQGNVSVLQFDVQSSAPPKQYDAGAWQPGHDENEFHPGFVNVFENDQISFYLPENALYDSIRFRYKEIMPAKGRTIFQLHTGNIPVHSWFPVRIRDLAALNPDKMVMYCSWGDKKEWAKAAPVTMGNQGGWYESSFRSFGNFQLIEDTLAPTIVSIGLRDGMNAAKLNRIAFVIRDNTKELENFTAFLDGKWIRFSNDKGSTFIYKFDEHCPPGPHVLKIAVEDCVGNRAERSYRFTR